MLGASSPLSVFYAQTKNKPKGLLS